MLGGGVDDLLSNLAFNDGASDDVEIKILYQKLLQELNQNEQLLLNGLYIEGKTISQISKELNISRKTLYQWRLKLQQKIKPIWGNTSAR